MVYLHTLENKKRIEEIIGIIWLTQSLHIIYTYENCEENNKKKKI